MTIVGLFYNEHHYNEFCPITNKHREAFRLPYSFMWKMLITMYLDITNSLYNEWNGIYTCMRCHVIFIQLKRIEWVDSEYESVYALIIRNKGTKQINE